MTVQQPVEQKNPWDFLQKYIDMAMDPEYQAQRIGKEAQLEAEVVERKARRRAQRGGHL